MLNWLIGSVVADTCCRRDAAPRRRHLLSFSCCCDVKWSTCDTRPKKSAGKVAITRVRMRRAPSLWNSGVRRTRESETERTGKQLWRHCRFLNNGACEHSNFLRLVRPYCCSVNSAFSTLRTLIPTEPKDRKLSKIETLRLASSYISHLGTQLIAGKSRVVCLVDVFAAILIFRANRAAMFTLTSGGDRRGASAPSSLHVLYCK